MGRRLLTNFIDAQPLYWGRPYVQNMREIRGYPNWWRIRDDEAYIDGPPQEGQQYTKELFNWKVEIVKDVEQGENTNTLELYNLVNTFEESTTDVNGETIYSFKDMGVPPELSYEHTDVIDSVSLEFDQLGRRLIAFESAGDVFLIWYDPVISSITVTNWGAGYNPQIVTDTYRRVGGSVNSERVLFYVDNTTKQIVYRRQNDRYQIVYALPSAPADIVELLKVSKNLYGGLTALYCYDDGTGSLKTGSFTARDDEDVVNIGTDRHPESQASVTAASGSIVDFVLKSNVKETEHVDKVSFIPDSGTIIDFVLRENTVNLNNKTCTASVSPATGTISDFSLKSVQIDAEPQKSSASISVTSGIMQDFLLKQTLISIDSYGVEDAEMTVVSGQIANFFLG